MATGTLKQRTKQGDLGIGHGGIAEGVAGRGEDR